MARNSITGKTGKIDEVLYADRMKRLERVLGRGVPFSLHLLPRSLSSPRGAYSAELVVYPDVQMVSKRLHTVTSIPLWRKKMNPVDAHPRPLEENRSRIFRSLESWLLQPLDMFKSPPLVRKRINIPTAAPPVIFYQQP